MRETQQAIARELWDTQVNLWPRTVLKWILFRDGVGPGSRLLEIRAEDTGFQTFARQLGIEVETRTPFQAGFRIARPPGEVGEEVWCSRFDLIVVRHHPFAHQLLHSEDALESTSRLLEELVPGGTLLIQAASTPDEATHSLDCWTRHLELFGGAVEQRSFGPGWKVWPKSGSFNSALAAWKMAALTRTAGDRQIGNPQSAMKSASEQFCNCLSSHDRAERTRFAA